MVLGFKPQFVEPILAGTKIHTIREDKTLRWDTDMTIHMATGVRTKNYHQFSQGVCKSIQKVFMTYSHMLEISIGDRYLYHSEKELLAKNDGFASYKEFEDWFYKVIKASKDDCFSGIIIHWTDFKYSK